LYNQLLDATIYVSNGIYKSISVVQDGEAVTVENNRANFHLDEDDDGLRLYVPRDENAREECFFRQLPRRLMTYLAISDPIAEASLIGIIGCRSLIAVDGILKDAGIVEVDGITQPSELDQGTHQFGYEGISVEDDTQTSPESQMSQSGRSTPISIPATVQAARTDANHLADIPPRSPGLDDERSPPMEPFLTLPEEAVYPIRLVDNAIRETGYASLLERVINSAGRMTIPVRGSHSVDNPQPVPSLEATLFESVFGARSMERDHKVGAAGELLVSDKVIRDTKGRC
jgi:hypothetical protein